MKWITIIFTVLITVSITPVVGDGSLGSTGALPDEDHDWYEENTTTHPSSINDHIYTNGHVGIGDILDPEVMVHIQTNDLAKVTNREAVIGLGYNVKGDVDYSWTGMALFDPNVAPFPLNRPPQPFIGFGPQDRTFSIIQFDEKHTDNPIAIRMFFRSNGAVGIGDPSTLLSIMLPDAALWISNKTNTYSILKLLDNQTTVVEVFDGGDIQLINYTESRDDTATTDPANFLYTDNAGNLLSSPLNNIILTSTGGFKYRLGVTDGGTIITTLVP